MENHKFFSNNGKEFSLTQVYQPLIRGANGSEFLAYKLYGTFKAALDHSGYGEVIGVFPKYLYLKEGAVE